MPPFSLILPQIQYKLATRRSPLVAPQSMELSFTVDGQQAGELLQIFDRELWLLWNADTEATRAV